MIILKCGEATFELLLSVRDVRLLDGKYFFEGGWADREMLGLAFIKGLKMPPVGVPLVTHNRGMLILRLKSLLVKLETQRDLLSFDYSFSLEDEPKIKHGGGMSGIAVEGGWASIHVRPAGYCNLTISNVGPNGRGREVEIIDMRVRREFQTSQRGKLKIFRRKAKIGWFDRLPAAIQFLEGRSEITVEVMHTS